MPTLRLIPGSEFQRIRNADMDRFVKLAILADMCRANALMAVKRAGSGHLGSSFSAMDIVTWLYQEKMNTIALGHDDPNRDVYFSSKGHDVPGLYAVLYSYGVIAEEKFLKLRRYGGLDGHPEVHIPGIEANSGSLGMGISKGRGMAWAKTRRGRRGHVYVLTGDGEWQEGQNYEALQAAAHQAVGNLTVIIDHNKLQSDKAVDAIVSLGDLEGKLASFGWFVARCDGHDFKALEGMFERFSSVVDRPKILVADTIKGRGVSFMEHPRALREGNGLYRWHAGAPDDDAYEAAYREITGRVNARLRDNNLDGLSLRDVTPGDTPNGESLTRLDALGEPVSEVARGFLRRGVSDEYVAEAYGDALLELAPTHPEMVVLDGDLSADCRIRRFENTRPEQFLENGIAEQDMVSMAGGLARMGLLPIVNSFASFLASRANEQIYNNACEGTRVIYACHYAGLIPAGPGKSHQSIRDISLLGALPNMIIVQPCNARETRMVVRYCVEDAGENCAIRLAIGPSPRKITLPQDYALTFGRGTPLTEGRDAVLFAYGPVMLHEAMVASEVLQDKHGFGLKVVNLPWLNRLDLPWFRSILEPYPILYVLEDHAPVGGLGAFLLHTAVREGLLRDKRFRMMAVDGYPACGTPVEALRAHGLNGDGIARRILADDPSHP